LKVKRHLVIVVAEGAGEGVRDLQRLKQGVERDQYKTTCKLINI